jgi:uncharacterized protein
MVEGVNAIIFGTTRSEIVKSEESNEAGLALRLTVEDGRIKRHHIYEDSLTAYRARHTPGIDG